METSSSLVVKLPVRVCDTCIDVLSHWFKPKSPRYELGSTWLVREVDEERFENRYNDPRWVWKVRNLKSAAQKCVFCRFLLQCLDSSPWMPYEDDDYIELESCFVGSTHTDLHDREMEDNQAQWNGGSFMSQYERFNRPRLQLFKKKAGDNEERRYTLGDYLFILPQPRFGKDQEAASIAQTFQGRIVDKKVDFSLVHQWFTTCKSNHVKSNMPKPKYSGSIQVHDCQPVLRPLIPHFRLVDVRERCVVMPKDPDSEYAALSYVWGSSKRFLLRSDNLMKLSTQGALSQRNEELPNTFRDAIAVTEQLGIRYLWIDAICIRQDNKQQLVEHINAMDSIYGSAILTIVSDTNGADSGIPGIGYRRQFDQAIFQCGNKSFISSKRTFGKALTNSPWESRAWCLQEKVFSKRLLIFTDTQTFYHCNCATWFEDTIMESREYTGRSVYIAERSSPFQKSARGPQYTAYEAHLPLFNQKNFWSLVETYSLRQLSFENDSIRAFSGILKSLESVYGSSIWGVPQYAFAKGMTWSLSPYNRDLRRPGFPSWSWAGWRGNNGSTLLFSDVLSKRFNIFDVEWHYYRLDEKGEYELTAIDDSQNPDVRVNPGVKVEGKFKTLSQKTKSLSPSSVSPESEPSSSSSLFDAPKSLLFDSSSRSRFLFDNLRTPREKSNPSYTEEHRKMLEEQANERKKNHTWCLPGHPGEPDYVYQPIPQFNHDPTTMQPLSYILRFYTSTAFLFIDPKSNPEYKTRDIRRGDPSKRHCIRVPHTSKTDFHISRDQDPPGKEKEVKLIYMSRAYFKPTDEDEVDDRPELLNIMWIEGDGEVKNKVKSFGVWTIDQWRLANPVWELVTLA